MHATRLTQFLRYLLSYISISASKIPKFPCTNKINQLVERWSLEPGAWSLEPGAWSLEPGAWSLEPGALDMGGKERVLMGGGGGGGGTNVSWQLKFWLFVSCHLNFGPLVSCQ